MTSQGMLRIALGLFTALAIGGCDSADYGLSEQPGGNRAASGEAGKNRPGEYRHQQNGFSIVPPKGWEASVDEDNDVTFTSAPENPNDEFLESLMVITEALPRTVDLEWYVNENHRGILARFPKSKRSGEVLEEINGLPAQRVVYDYTKDDMDFRALAYILVKGKRGYVLMGVTPVDAYDRQKGKFEGICRTFIAD